MARRRGLAPGAGGRERPERIDTHRRTLVLRMGAMDLGGIGEGYAVPKGYCMVLGARTRAEAIAHRWHGEPWLWSRRAGIEPGAPQTAERITRWLERLRKAEAGWRGSGVPGPDVAPDHALYAGSGDDAERWRRYWAHEEEARQDAWQRGLDAELADVVAEDEVDYRVGLLATSGARWTVGVASWAVLAAEGESGTGDALREAAVAVVARRPPELGRIDGVYHVRAALGPELPERTPEREAIDREARRRFEAHCKAAREREGLVLGPWTMLEDDERDSWRSDAAEAG